MVLAASAALGRGKGPAPTNNSLPSSSYPSGSSPTPPPTPPPLGADTASLSSGSFLRLLTMSSSMDEASLVSRRARTVESSFLASPFIIPSPPSASSLSSGATPGTGRRVAAVSCIKTSHASSCHPRHTWPHVPTIWCPSFSWKSSWKTRCKMPSGRSDQSTRASGSSSGLESSRSQTPPSVPPSDARSRRSSSLNRRWVCEVCCTSLSATSVPRVASLILLCQQKNVGSYLRDLIARRVDEGCERAGFDAFLDADDATTMVSAGGSIRRMAVPSLPAAPSSVGRRYLPVGCLFRESSRLGSASTRTFLTPSRGGSNTPRRRGRDVDRRARAPRGALTRSYRIRGGGVGITRARGTPTGTHP